MSKRTAILALLFAVLASAKTYTFTVADPALAGTEQLTKGEYKLEVDGSNVILKDKNGNRLEITATVENVEQKFDRTAFVWSTRDGVRRLESVQLGGTRSRIQFQ
jgi:hypothetical protein